MSVRTHFMDKLDTFARNRAKNPPWEEECERSLFSLCQSKKERDLWNRFFDLPCHRLSAYEDQGSAIAALAGWFGRMWAKK